MRGLFKLHHLFWVLPVVAVAVVVVACGSSTPKAPTAATSVAVSPGTTPGPAPGPTSVPGTTGSSGTGSSGLGTLVVTIKDSPFSEASALLVTFSEVSVHTAGTGTDDGEWVTLPFANSALTRSCDLKRLVAATDVLGTASLTAGHYTQIRLTVSSATIYKQTITTGDVCAEVPTIESTLPTPPPTAEAEKGISVDVPSGTLKLNREFTVPSGGATTILLDFDGDKSVHQTGNGKYKMTPVIGIVSVQ